MEKIIDKHGREYEIEGNIPQGYRILNDYSGITGNYLTLGQPISKHESDAKTRKAIKCEDTKDILYCVLCGQPTVKKMNTYIKKYSKSKNIAIIRRVEKMKKAVGILKELDGYENLVD